MRLKPFGEPIEDDRYKRAYAALFTTVAVIMLALIVYEITVFGQLVDHGDSPTYIESGLELFSGRPGFWRTPLYAALTTGLELAIGVRAGSAVLMTLQCAAFMISVAVVGDIARSMMPGHNRAAFAATCVYGLMPWTVALVVLRLPESLTVSMMVFLVRSLQQWIIRRSPLMAARVAMWTLLMIAARPVFVYLLPLTGMFFIIGFFKQDYRRGAAAGLALTLVSTGCTMAYRSWMERTYGAPVLTVANIVNNYFLLLENRLLTVSDIDDPDLRADLECGGDTIHTNLSFAEMSRVATEHTRAAYIAESDAVARHLPEIAMIAVSRLGDMASGRPWFHVWERFIPDRYNPVCVGWIFVIMVVYTILLIFKRHKMKPQIALQWAMLSIAVAQTTVVAAGAMSDWGRLTVQIFPIAIIMAARAFAAFTSHKSTTAHMPNI